ncbi:MAG: FecR family protein [Balneolaceae bacterium]
MKQKLLYRIPAVVLGLLCLGLVWADIEEVSNNRELAIVRRHIPSVFINNAERNSAEIGTTLFDGDTLFTDADGYALVMFMDQSITRVRPESQLVIRGSVNADQSTFTRIDVNEGEVFLNVNRQGNSNVEVSTTRSVASVKGTEFGARSTGFYWVEEGEVEVTARESGEVASLTERMFAQVSLDGMDIETGILTEAQLNNLANDYQILNSDIIERKLRFRFMDENGQIREIELDYYESEN